MTPIISKSDFSVVRILKCPQNDCCFPATSGLCVAQIEGIKIGVWCQLGDVMLRGGQGVVKVCPHDLEKRRRRKVSGRFSKEKQ